MALTSKQRAALRGAANTMDPVYQIGKGEIDDTLKQGIADCIAARELIKVKVLENSEYDPREAADILCEALDCDCVQVIGSKFVLYLQKKKDSAYANAASVADLAGATATSQLGTIWYDTCLPQIENANILPAQETAPAMLVALNSGACDIVVTDRPTAQAALVAYPDFTLLDFGGGDNDFQVSDEDINIGISMKKGNTALKDAINEVLATMTADDYNTMMDEAISVQPLSE